MSKFNISLITFFIFSTLLAQEDVKSFKVKYIASPIVIDGILEESVWQTAESANTFQQYFPTDSVEAKQTTIIKMLYDDKNLYLGLRMNAKNKEYIIPSLRRDFRAGGNDNISLLFDTFNDGTNAFLFGINPYGIRREALITNGGSNRRDFTTSWDVKWRGESKIYEDYYTAELVIPLTSFKFKEGETKWRFNSYRFDTQENEQSTWVKIPQNQLIFNLAFMGDMVFEKPLGKSKTPLTLIPYVNGFSGKDFEEDINTNTFKFGGDAKVAIGNSLNLDLTLNPDFSTVEVDNFITNLTRFEIALPERRQFFVDNNDLFGSFGGRRDANPFFSRRIGIAEDAEGNTIENAIIGGARLSGKLNNNLRLGFLNIQTEEDPDNLISSNNNMMLSLQQKVFSRSNISAFFINRQRTSTIQETAQNTTQIQEEAINIDSLNTVTNFNRVIGIDYNLASKDNTWIGKYYAHKSFQPGDSKGNYSLGVFTGYNSKKYGAFVDLVFVDEDYTSDLGFIRRTDIFNTAIRVNRQFWPVDSKINNHSFSAFALTTLRPNLEYQNTDRNFNLNWNASFTNLSEIEIGFSNQYVFLTDEFEPTGLDDAIALPSQTSYNYNSFNARYRSDRRKVFSYSIEPRFGGFFNGELYSIQVGSNLRLQPKFNFGLDLRYDSIQLPDPHSSTNLWLITPRFDITFSKSIFWSSLIQYSNQRDNIGINSRLQWRFAPLSDLFIVYNDNYFVNTFAPRNRSINLKLTYWLNI